MRASPDEKHPVFGGDDRRDLALQRIGYWAFAAILVKAETPIAMTFPPLVKNLQNAEYIYILINGATHWKSVLIKLTLGW